MTKEEVLHSLVVQTESKLVMVVIDGIGGLPVRGKTELEAAKIPNLDRLASKAICGLIDPDLLWDHAWKRSFPFSPLWI